MVIKEQVKGFFAGVTGDQGGDTPPLLPTKAKDGAPKDNKWLMHFVEGDMEVRYTKDDEHPYISYRAEVDEPVEYAGHSLFGMLFFPRSPDSDSAESQKRYEAQRARIVGQVDAVLGEGTCASLDTGTLEESLFALVPMLENVAFVGTIGLERGKKRDPDDESKDAERYPDRNRIRHFAPADTWEG